MPYTLAYKDRFLRVLETRIESDTSDSIAFASMADNEPNRLIAEWTGKQYTKLLSAVITGAELMFPDEANEVIWQLIKVVHQPIQFDEESSDCFNYLPSAPFVTFTPQNPYNQPDYIPDDYLVPPFFVNSELAYPTAFGYLATDVFIDGASINIDPIDLLTLNLPQIKIRVYGAGQIELDLLAVTLGSQAIIKVGSPPNIFDVIVDGLTEDVTIIDLNVDSLSVPPETDILYSEEINIEAESGIATDVYIVFVPNLDDSLIPLRYGGGIRQIGLCGFESAGVIMGIQDIRFNVASCNLETLVDGEWTVVTGWENWLDCVPSGGGGGAGAAITVITGTMGTAGTGSTTTTSTSFVDISGYNFPHTPTRSNMLVICENIMLVNSSTNQPITVRIVRGGGGAGLDANEAVAHNLTSLPLSVSERFAVTPGVAATIELQWKVAAGTATCSHRQTVNVTILEYDNAEDLFVEDIRIVDGELQKKIGGAWIPVTESLAALLDTIAAAASAAQTTANTATSTNTTQQTQINSIITVNNTQNTRLTNLESFQSDAELSFLGIQAQLDNHESRIDALEATALAITPLEFWYKEWSFLSSASGWTSPTAPWVSGQGFVYDSAFRLQLLSETLFDNRITHMKLNVRKYTGGFGTATIEWVNTTGFAVIRMSGGTLLNSVWTQVGNLDSQPNIPDFLISNFSGEIRVEGIKLLGRGSNIFP